MKQALPALLAGAALLCAATAAHAANSSYTFGAGPAQFRVLDLTPTDTVTAGFTFISGSTSLAAEASGLDHPVSDYAEIGYGQVGSVHAGLPGGSANGAADAAGATVLSYSINGPTPATGFSVSIAQQVVLTLRPGSMLMLDGSVFDNAVGIDSGADVYAYTTIWLTDSTFSESNSAFNWGSGWGNPVGSRTRRFQLAYSNLTDTDMTVRFESKSVMGVSQIPEPSTWLMLLAGVAVAGAFARRRANP